MIATHSAKIFDSRVQQEAIRAKIIGNVPNKFLSSLKAPIRFFAAPSNAANMNVFRETAVQIEADIMTLDDLGLYLPDLQDGRVKQVLLPLSSTNNDYVALTPLPSLSVIDEFNNCISKSYLYKIVQPNPIAFSNHGDPLAKNSGKVKLLRNKLHAFPQIYVGEPIILFTARCEKINISSCYVSCGLPAITAIGGAVHVIERKTGLALPFAFGIKNVGGEQTASKGVTTSRDIAKSSRSKAALFTDEITATADIAIAIKYVSDKETEAVIAAFLELTRIAGGVLFDVSCGLTRVTPDYHWYVHDEDPGFPPDIPDTIKFVSENITRYALIQTGYALLEDMKTRKMSRAESGLHAWCEPIFSIIRLGNLGNNSFYQLQSKDNVFYWGE